MTAATTAVSEDDLAGEAAKPSQIFAIFIRATRERIWQALTSSEDTLRYYYASTVESDWAPGTPSCTASETSPRSSVR